MTTPATIPKSQVIIAGGETTLPYEFFIEKQEELVVTKQLASTGAVVPLDLDTDYTVAAGGLQNDNGGTITPINTQSPVTAGDIWTFTRDTTTSRAPDFNKSGGFLAETINSQLDKLTRITQDNQLRADAAVQLDPGVGDTLNPFIPQPIVNRALIILEPTTGNFEIAMSDSDFDTIASDAAASAAAAAASESAAAQDADDAAASAADAAASAATAVVLQIKQGTLTSVFTASIGINTYVAIGGLTVSITPSSVNNKILISGFVGALNRDEECAMKITVNGGDIAAALGDASNSNTRAHAGAGDTFDSVNSVAGISFQFLHSPGVTTAQLYGVSVAPLETGTDIVVNRGEDGATTTADSSRSMSVITVQEIKG